MDALENEMDAEQTAGKGFLFLTDFRRFTQNKSGTVMRLNLDGGIEMETKILKQKEGNEINKRKVQIWKVGGLVLFIAGLCLGGLGMLGRLPWQKSGDLYEDPQGRFTNVIQGVLLLAFPSWRFRSTWMGIIVHSVENVFIAFLILGVILGLA